MAVDVDDASTASRATSRAPASRPPKPDWACARCGTRTNVVRWHGADARWYYHHARTRLCRPCHRARAARARDDARRCSQCGATTDVGARVDDAWTWTAPKTRMCVACDAAYARARDAYDAMFVARRDARRDATECDANARARAPWTAYVVEDDG